MILYQIQDEYSKEWLKDDSTWGLHEDAMSIHNQWVAEHAAWCIQRQVDSGHIIRMRRPVVREFDPFAALRVLRDLNSVRLLSDYTYDVREREGKGWEGPLVTKWSDACVLAQKLLGEET
jgi:hypothetical protein